MSNKWCYSTKIPDENYFCEVVSQCKNLKWTHSEKKSTEDKNLFLKDSIDKIMPPLTQFLITDYNENYKDKILDYEFEYVIYPENNFESIGIYIRLFSLEKGGNIFYGPMITRLNQTIYQLWVEKDEE